MKTVRIADLKARLREFLRAVRRGDTFLVLDRDTPMAQLVPCGSPGQPVTIRPPLRRHRKRPRIAADARPRWDGSTRSISHRPCRGGSSTLAMATHDDALALAARASGMEAIGV